MFKNGIDNLEDYAHLFEGKRVALITNPSGVTRDLKATADILAARFNLTLLFGPEHGIRGAAQDGVKIADETDPVLKIPVISLHGASLSIPDESFSQFDILAYDIQDVGARFYTYLYTLAYAMKAAARHNTPLIVFDRINMVGNVITEGNCLDMSVASFIGEYPMPARYAMTIGEYAQYINETFGIHCDLTVVPCCAHPRSTTFAQTDLPWVSPSPNIATPLTALVYSGTCLFEGTNISEGRGTVHPFEYIGAPFIDATKLTAKLEKLKLPGILWRPVHFTPTTSKHAGELCHGVQLHLIDQDTARPFEAGLWLFHTIWHMYPRKLTFLEEHFDRLMGTHDYRLCKISTQELIAKAKADSQRFADETKRFHIYP